LKQRLQKLISQAGIASRRKAEELIVRGHVRVNGKVVQELGAQADAHRDRVEVDGRRLVTQAPVYFLFHKPREVVSTLSDPEGRESLRSFTREIPERVYPVGRLDYHTSGVLLLTNDGELTAKLLHPRAHVAKVYVAKVKGMVTDEQIEILEAGVRLQGESRPTAKCSIQKLRFEPPNTWLQVTLYEGRNRQVHRMFESIGLRVQRLARTSFAGLAADGVLPGELRPLSVKEVAALQKLVASVPTSRSAGR
jgi:23S rRNA pseudouridine2605 synthase